jgi:hypothetical protein
MKPARRCQQPAVGWSKQVVEPDRLPNLRRLRQEIAAFSGAGLFLFHWRDQIAQRIEGAEDDVDVLLDVDNEVRAFDRAVVAFADWRAVR